MDSLKKRISDRIIRILQIEGLSAWGHLAAGEKNPINPVNPVSKKKLNIESIQHSVPFRGKILRLICYRNYEWEH
jgi:hypothetical protein